MAQQPGFSQKKVDVNVKLFQKTAPKPATKLIALLIQGISESITPKFSVLFTMDKMLPVRDRKFTDYT